MKDYPNLDTKAATDNQAMDTILSLTEKLQRAEARALAAEMVIAKMHSSLSDEADYCSDDGPNEAMRWQGKLEFYSRSFREDGYAAAREVLRKAEGYDRLMLDFESHPDFKYTAVVVERDYFIAQADAIRAERDNIAAECSQLDKQVDAITTERDELAALVDRKDKALKDMIFYACEFPESTREQINEFCRSVAAAKEIAAITPATALSDLKAQVRREVLEEAAKLVDSKAAAFLAECKKDGEADTKPYTTWPFVGNHLLLQFAAELRRMAEGK